MLFGFSWSYLMSSNPQVRVTEIKYIVKKWCKIIIGTLDEDLVSTERTHKYFHNSNVAFLQIAWKIGGLCPQAVKRGPSLELTTCSAGTKANQQHCNFPAISQSGKCSRLTKSIGARPRPRPGKLSACAWPGATTAWWRHCPPRPFHPLSPLFRIPLSNSIRAELASSSCSP